MSQDMLGIALDFLSKLHSGAITEAQVKRFLRGENPFEPKIVGTFNPAAFIGKRWKVVGERKALPEGWNPRQLVGISPLKPEETYIDGHEWKKRLADKPLRGVEAFWICWNNQQEIPDELKSKIILFDGDELCDPDGDRCSLVLYWNGLRWHWNYNWLDVDRYANCVSASAS